MISSMHITRKANGSYVIEFKDTSSDEVKMVGAAKASPVAQAIRLVDRLVTLSDRIAGYNQ